jgi:signal peptidase II
MSDARQTRRFRWRWLVLALLVIVADQVSKLLALLYLQPHQPVPVFPTFDLMLTFNSGAAFSFLSDAGGWQRWLFIALALGISVFLLKWLFALRADERWLAAALALVLGGAIGNLFDRVFRDGKVVDFVYLHYQNFHWPAFNIADSAICVGAVLLVAQSLFSPTIERQQNG